MKTPVNHPFSEFNADPARNAETYKEEMGKHQSVEKLVDSVNVALNELNEEVQPLEFQMEGLQSLASEAKQKADQYKRVSLIYSSKSSLFQDAIQLKESFAEIQRLHENTTAELENLKADLDMFDRIHLDRKEDAEKDAQVAEQKHQEAVRSNRTATNLILKLDRAAEFLDEALTTLSGPFKIEIISSSFQRHPIRQQTKSSMNWRSNWRRWKSW
jgi:chromosome segregation ATPase